MSEVTEEISSKTKQYAEKIINRLKQELADFVPKWWRTAELFFEIKKDNLWAILGYESRTAFREEMRIGKSTWHSKLRLWEEFAIRALADELLTRKQLDRMSPENVKQLLRLDTRRRFNEKWIHKALTMKEGELEAQVDHVLENNEEPETSLNQPEAHALLKVQVTVSQKKFILATLAAFQAAHSESLPDGDNLGAILESMCAEVNSGLAVPVGA